MTEEFKDMLELFQCAAQGKDCPNIEHAAFEKIRKKAIEQGTWYTIFNNYKKLFEKKHTDEEAIQYIESENNIIILSVFRDIRKKEVLKKILSDCKNSGVECILLKGFFFAQLYADPNFRISSDIDLYVEEKNEEIVVDILKRHGYSCSKRLKKEYHRECMNNSVGLIELHVSLYDSYCKDIWFDNVADKPTEPFVEIETSDGYKYTVLGYTDNYIFSVLHFIKHFISGGVGIRQLMDIMLFAKKYKNMIDVKRYIDLMCSMHFDTLMDVMAYIAIKYLGFDKDDLIFCREKTDYSEFADDVLDIIEGGGLFGRYSSELDNFSQVYTEMCLRKKGDNYISYLKKNIKVNGFMSSMFVSRKQLSNKYLYAKKAAFLLPIAWIHRLIHATLSVNKTKKLTISNMDNKKVRVLKKIKVLDDELIN